MDRNRAGGGGGKNIAGLTVPRDSQRRLISIVKLKTNVFVVKSYFHAKRYVRLEFKFDTENHCSTPPLLDPAPLTD